ncbi:hypothetical protein MTR67_001683 [Solanum verrucosum]|uniref:Uncharacterized protein n=1 Tax=Solanum verrucosum TaxID=315347 RepID=A0AAF0PP04_SOLVR|nr:hypothetical protein MTR67_001683 [Solanum verrucosum]
MNIRPELHPIQKGEKIEVPIACYTLSPEEKHKLCLFLKNLKVPDGFSSNISQCVNLKDHKISGLKSHDCHVFLQHLPPLALRGMLSKEVCEPLIELSLFFSVLGSKELRIDNLEHIEAQIPITLCKLEKVFPPSFYDVMVHSTIHLAIEAKIAGPIHYRWMYPVERWLYFLKSFIGNKACPEGCIAEGYIANECMTLCSRRCCLIMEDLLSLSREPTRYSVLSNGYIVNGYRFHVEDYDKKLRTRNCGVVVLGENDKDSENLDYYGVLTDVIELQFVMDRRVMLFRCNWFDVYDEIKGVKKDEYDFLSVNPDRFLKTNEPFVLADQASQVFYANVNSNKGWQVVRKTQPRDSYEIVEQMNDDIVELGSPSQKKHKRTNEVKIKMKPLKTENEVDSSMKSTIRKLSVLFLNLVIWLINTYKKLKQGRGQGLTNSTLFTSQGMATIPKNSIDLEKENKQTNPSAHASTNIGKGRGQGLTNSILFTSQGMATKPKNSIDLEKEHKQTNPSTHAWTNLGKGRGQGLKSSTFSTSQGMGMKHNNYMASDSEVECINKSALYANQHIKTPSKSTRVNSTMSSSKEMQRMEKMILEKEDMQTNSFPPSIDQIIEYSQITEKGMHKFEAVDMNDHRDHIMGWMNELWNKWRGYLHEKYVKDNPIQQSLKNIPRVVDKKEWEWLVKEHFTSESFQQTYSRDYLSKGGKDGNPPNLETIFFETRRKYNKVVEPEAIEKHAQLEEIVQEDPSLASIEIVEKCCGPQTRSHVFGFGGGVKAKDLKGGTSSKAEILSALRSTRDDNRFLNEENKSLIE